MVRKPTTCKIIDHRTNYIVTSKVPNPPFLLRVSLRVLLGVSLRVSLRVSLGVSLGVSLRVSLRVSLGISLRVWEGTVLVNY